MKKFFLLITCVIACLAVNAQDKKVPISKAVATSEQPGNEAENAIDGTTGTIWHTNWNTGTTFPVTLTITLEEISHVDYVRYTPRQDGNQNGNWNTVHVAYCPTTNGTSFTNVGKYPLNGSSKPYDFILAEGGVECGQIQFTIESGYNHHAAAAEITPYIIDNSKVQIFEPYFTDNLYTELKPEITNSEGIEDATVKALVDNLLSDAEGYKKFRVGEYEAYMPTSTLRNMLKVSSQYNNYENPTGIYLKEGESCYVIVEGIDNYPADLRIKNWYTNENSSSYALRNGLNYITATTEGNVFVSYYTDDFKSAPNIKAHFVNAPVQGYWDQATMTNEDWIEMLAGRASDDHTIIITRSEHAQLAYPVSAWLKHCPTNVDSTMTLYQQVQWAERDIMGLERYGKQMKNRQLFYATNYGFMAAGGEGAYCEYGSLGAIMKPDAASFDFWGVGHEWGHNNQVTPGFKWSGCGETTNNIYASWAQLHFTGSRDAAGRPTYLRLEDERSGVGEYSGMRGGRMQTYFEEGIRKGVAWQLQDGPDYHGATPDTKTVAGQNANGGSIGQVTTTSRNYDHFVKLVPFWQLNLWGTLAGKCPDIIPMVIESIRTTPNYGTTYNTNGKQQINWIKLACDSTKIDLLPFFEKAGMLRPIHAYIEDYGAGWNIITEEMIDKLKTYVKEQGYPAFTEEINYINAHNYHIYRDSLKLEVPTTLGKGCNVSGNKITVQHNTIKNAVAFETYNIYGKLLRITMYGLGSNDGHTFTQVLYPKDGNLETSAAYIMAVGYDGTRIRIYEEEDIEVLLKNELTEFIKETKSHLTRVDTTGTKIGYLAPDSIIELTALINNVDSMIEHVDPSVADYEGWYMQLKTAVECLSANSNAHIPISPECFYSITLSSNNSRYIGTVTAGLNTSVLTEVTDNALWRLISTETPNTYYLQNRETGNYISIVQKGQRAKAASNNIAEAVAFKLIPDAPGEFFIQHANTTELNLYNNSNNRVLAGEQTGNNAKWMLRLEENLLSLPKISTDEEMPVYYMQRTDNREYAYHKSAGRTDKGRITSSTLDDTNNFNYWFYFTEGNAKGTYAIYNYATGLPITTSGNKLYANKESETTIDYTIALNEDYTGLIISAEEGAWYMTSSKLAELSNSSNTTWILQRIRTISLTNEPLTSLTINKAEAKLIEGDSITLTIETAPVFATNHTVTWNSSDTSVATVDENGTVKAIAKGNATITATANDGSGLTATCKITVENGAGITTASTGMSVQAQGNVIVITGIDKGTMVDIYDTAGKQIAQAIAANGAATIDTQMPEGSTVIVKIGEHQIKISLK